MNKRILLLFYFLSLVAGSTAQTTFIKTLGGTDNDKVNSAIKLGGNNFLLIGSTRSFGSGETDGYLARVNGSAKEIWDKSIGGSGDDILRNGILLSDGSLVIVGWTTSHGNGGRDMLVSRMSIAGQEIWTKTFGGGGDDEAYSALETSDGNLLIAGHSRSVDSGEFDIFCVKITKDGELIWSKTYGFDDDERFTGQTIVENANGNYLINGVWENSNGSTQHDGLFLELDADGNLVSTKSYGGDMSEGFTGLPSSLIKTSEGYISFSLTQSWGGTNDKIWITNFNENLEIIWSKTFELSGEYLGIGNITVTSDGHFLVGAYGFTLLTNDTRAMIIKLTSNGEVVWSKSYGGSGFEFISPVFEVNGGVLAFGATSTYGAGGEDVLVVRGDDFGTISGCSEDLNLITTDVNPIQEDINFDFEDHTLVGGDPLLDFSNISISESVVCDGCDAEDLVAGLFCETAPIICSLDCLDGFTGTLPDEFILPQPEPLCNGGGTPNNISWFAFVAGSNSVDLSIFPSNCDTIYDEATGLVPQTIGIQAAVYEDCSFESGFICEIDCSDVIANDVNIASDQFVPGQVYYLLVDGCGGSICDYEVVVNSAQQPFEIDEITTISNNLNFDLDVDTLCQGTEMTFTLDNFDQEVDFTWVIDPPTAEYPSGIHPVTDTSTVTFQFFEEGCFDIQVYAYNECDNSETRTFNVCVQPLADEYFSDIYVCQECFPITLVTPESGCIITEGGGAPTVLIEDPNGDGAPGWFSDALINGPGLDSNLVTTNLGCTYMQYVNVIEIPLSPRENVDLYFCPGDFPMDINGTIFNSPGDTRNITLEGGAASGCDSLMSITANAIEYDWEYLLGDCEAGQVELAFFVENIPLNKYDSIRYTWFDENLDIVLDNNGIDSVLVVMQTGSYFVQVASTVEGVTCSETFPYFLVDVDNLAPNVPTITFAPNEICVSLLEAKIYVEDQNIGEEYIWTFNPNLPYTFGLTSDTVYVDVTSGQDFEFCVRAMNGCGSTGDICDDVVVIELPESQFMYDAEICIDSLVSIEYTGSSIVSPTTIFNWDFDGGVITNGMDANSGGPFELEFPSAGQYTVSLMVSESDCNSISTTHTIDVFERFIPPMIECESEAGSVTFTWDNTNVEYLDFTILTSQPFESTLNSITVNDLDSEEDVSVQFIFNALDICGGATVIEDCTSLPCPAIELEIVLSDQDICLEEGSDVVLDVLFDGAASEDGIWESPYITTDNIFNIQEAGIGQHLINYEYQLGDCTFNVDTLITIFPSPEAEIEISISFCEEMGSNLVDIFTSADNIVMLDDEVLSDFENVEVGIGDHTLTVTSPDGCMIFRDFVIESYGVEELTIIGDSSVVSGNSENYTASFLSSLEDLILVWTLDNDTICVNCYDVNIIPEVASELCVSITFGDDCTISECMHIEITEITELYIPNAFSPNNDNVNDQFTINSNSSVVFVEEIMIFDRWGELVFNRKGFNLSEDSNYWNGMKNGDLCSEGVYVYVITFLDEENRKKRITGDLTLFR